MWALNSGEDERKGEIRKAIKARKRKIREESTDLEEKKIAITKKNARV